MSREEQNPYSVLGLKSRASHNEVKQAYRSLCRKFHPDKAAHLDEATRREREAQMVRLNVAYQVLNSPQQRFDYDLAQPRPETPGEATGESAFDRPSTPSYARANPSGGKFRYQRPEALAWLAMILSCYAGTLPNTPSAVAKLDGWTPPSIRRMWTGELRSSQGGHGHQLREGHLPAIQTFKGQCPGSKKRWTSLRNGWRLFAHRNLQRSNTSGPGPPTTSFET
ncbi:unnamed protein product [Effrenium voratum]|nr:unnamed protein product [Effrenium voratum]